MKFQKPPLPSHPDTAAAAIRARVPGFVPRLGLVLGSGLGPLARRVDAQVSVIWSNTYKQNLTQLTWAWTAGVIDGISAAGWMD